MTTRPDPVEAEAIGQSHILVKYAGRDWSIPLDVDNWPLTDLLACVVVDDTRININFTAVTTVLRQLLGPQWMLFSSVAPTRKKLIPAAQAFAAAVGIPASSRTDVAFGGIPRLLRELRDHPGPVEATLAGLGLDLRDRYLFHAGRRRLTLRQIHNRLNYAPYDSPLNIARNGRRPLSDAALVSMDVFEALTNKTHPDRPLTPLQLAERRADEEKKAKARADYEARRSAEKDRRNGIETAQRNALEARKVAHA